MASNSVNIYLRMRPALIGENSSPAKTYIDINSSSENMIVIENQPYAFDNVFYSNSSQEDIFQRIEPSIDNLLNGFNSCTCAYGQSGAGKSYTMGLNEKISKGMVTLSLDSLFAKLSARNQPEDPIDFDVSISYIEIYNEKVYDLLDDKSTESILTKGSKYAGSRKVAIQSSDDAKEILAKGNKNRHFRSTVLNATSSRSHAAFSIFLNMREKNKEIGAVFYLVDLAGSEGIRNTNHQGIAQQEGIYINKGLLTLERVIKGLAMGNKVIAYRESVLTTVLLECLNTDSFFSLIACVSPARKDHSVTVSTVKFAQSCKALENRAAPEMNAYLQKQRLLARPPLKTYMLPLSRNESLKTPGKALHKTPAKTPGRIHPKTPSTIKGATGTVRKQPMSLASNRFHSFVGTPSKRITTAKPARFSEFPQASNTSYAPKESIDFSINNVSSSTEVEGPNTTHLVQPPAPPTFSPLLRQIDATIDRKLNLFMTSFLNQTAAARMDDQVRDLRLSIRDAVVMGVNESRRDASDIIETTFDVPKNAACSTVLRPAVPVFTFNDENQPTRRTNRRLMTTDLEVQNSPLRLSNSLNASQLDETVVRQVPGKKSPVRRSTRISVMKAMKDVRRSKENVMPTIVEKSRRKTTMNKIVAGFLNEKPNAKKISKKEHQQGILELFNTGIMKDLKLLPSVGATRAYSIVSYRAVHGKFKNIEQVNKALGMSAKSWNAFKKKNMLD